MYRPMTVSPFDFVGRISEGPADDNETYYGGQFWQQQQQVRTLEGITSPGPILRKVQTKSSFSYSDDGGTNLVNGYHL
jgi:hypothetical protein